MNPKMVVKLTSIGGLILLVAMLLRGHDYLTAAVLISAFLVIAAKVISAIRYGRRNRWRHGGNGGSSPPLAPALVPTPKPPGAPPEVYCQRF